MSTGLNVPVYVRTQELAQTKSMTAEAISSLKQAGLDDRADELTRVYTEHVKGIENEPRESPEWAAYLSMPADDWRTLVSGLGRLDGLDTWWLQTKLVGRLNDRMEQMEDDE